MPKATIHSKNIILIFENILLPLLLPPPPMDQITQKTLCGAKIQERRGNRNTLIKRDFNTTTI